MLDDAPTLDMPAWVRAAVGDPILGFAAREWSRAAGVPGAWYDEALAEGIVERWPTLFCHTEGRLAGKPFHLAPWQAAVVRLIVGWRTAEGFRLYRRLILWIARKNGKSELIAALALLFWLLDGEMGGQAYAMARNEKQAKIPFEKAKTMARLSPALAEAVRVFKTSLYCPELWARFELLSGTAEGKHGLSASVIVGDEIHEWPDEALYTTLHQSTAARDQPIELLASTAGYKGRGYGWSMWEENQAIVEGRLADPSTMVVIFAADPDDDWTDEEVWRKANPNLGISPKLDYLRAECEKAKENPRLEANFRRYHCNQWVENSARWLPLPRWDACTGPVPWNELLDRMCGRTCFAGLDLSSTRDVTALALLFPPTDDDSRWSLGLRMFVPEETVDERVRLDRVDYDRWVRSGALETTVGNAVDQNAIKDAILEESARFDIRAVGYDPWNAHKLATELLEEGAPMVEMRQGIPTLGEPSKELERLVFAGALAHGGHPMLRWMAGNVVVVMDRNANFKPDKARSSEKIDGIVATIMALGLAMAPDQDAPFIYQRLVDGGHVEPEAETAHVRGDLDEAILADPGHPRFAEMRDRFEALYLAEDDE